MTPETYPLEFEICKVTGSTNGWPSAIVAGGVTVSLIVTLDVFTILGKIPRGGKSYSTEVGLNC